jgi:ketosteroid isomerase-like protein
MNNKGTIFFISLIVIIMSGKMIAQDLKPLYENELNFCKTLNEIGYAKSFLKFIADEGIMFLPTPKPAKESLEKSTNDFKNLFWHAEFAEISADGNFAYTTGPWYTQSVSSKGDTIKTFGHFNTVWTKIKGEWKFLIDCGINYDKSAIPNLPVGTSYLKPVPKMEGKPGRFPFEDLLVADDNFFTYTSNESLKAAYKIMASQNIRVYRPGKYPACGLEAAMTLLTDTKLSFVQLGGQAAASGDLAYTYGIAGDDSRAPEFNYMRVWKKEGKTWKIVLDVLIPIKKD